MKTSALVLCIYLHFGLTAASTTVGIIGGVYLNDGSYGEEIEDWEDCVLHCMQTTGCESLSVLFELDHQHCIYHYWTIASTSFLEDPPLWAIDAKYIYIPSFLDSSWITMYVDNATGGYARCKRFDSDFSVCNAFVTDKQNRSNAQYGCSQLMAYFNDVPGYLAEFSNSDLLNEVLIYASGACPSCKFWTGLIRDGDNFVFESNGTPIPLDGLDMSGVSNDDDCFQMRFANNVVYLVGASCDKKSVYICQIKMF